ncbi:MAG: universal stress protein [Polyangia bacterium]
MTVWCGTDFSLSAGEAAQAAVALAERLRAPVRLLHVIDELGAEQTVGSEEDAVYSPQRARMAETVRAITAQHPDLDVRGEVVPGFVGETLSRAADRRDDLLVVAALGRRPASVQRLLGGSAEQTAQRARAPLLVVRRAEPFGVWSAARPLRVVVGVERSLHSRAAVRFVESLRQLAPCDVTLLHIVEADQRAPQSERAAAVGAAGDQLLPPMEEELRSWLGPLAGAGLQRIQVERNAERVDEALAEHAANADLLVLGTHQRRGLARLWHGSVSRGVLAMAATNVALVPTPIPAEVITTPVQYRSVLVPVDLARNQAVTQASLQAVPHAIAMLARGGTLHLLHVVTGAPLPQDVAEPLRAELRALVERLTLERDLSLETHILFADDVSSAILQTAERLRVEVLCMAPLRPRSVLAELVLGSTTRKVLARCRCPILIVPPQESWP